jgi:hypothetical protein
VFMVRFREAAAASAAVAEYSAGDQKVRAPKAQPDLLLPLTCYVCYPRGG